MQMIKSIGIQLGSPSKVVRDGSGSEVKPSHPAAE